MSSDEFITDIPQQDTWEKQLKRIEFVGEMIERDHKILALCIAENKKRRIDFCTITVDGILWIKIS